MAKKVLTQEELEIKAIKKKYRKEKWEKICALVLSAVIVFSVLSIGKKSGADKVAKATESADTTDSQEQLPENDAQSTDSTSSTTGDDAGEQSSNNSSKTETVNKEELSKDPSQWTKEQIAQYYKLAATKSHATAESSQTMALKKMVVNDGDGALGFFINMVKPVIDSVIEKQATTYGGITGGYKNLVASDINTAKAYKEGKYIVIEMRMVEQTDGMAGDAQGGTVGHAINVLGNIETAVAEFPDFDIRYKEADIKIHYADPLVRVRINENDIIEKGTWSYVAEIDIKHLQIESVMVDKAEAEIEYVIVVGGGF